MIISKFTNKCCWIEVTMFRSNIIRKQMDLDFYQFDMRHLWIKTLCVGNEIKKFDDEPKPFLLLRVLWTLKNLILYFRSTLIIWLMTWNQVSNVHTLLIEHIFSCSYFYSSDKKKGITCYYINCLLNSFLFHNTSAWQFDFLISRCIKSC